RGLRLARKMVHQEKEVHPLNEHEDGDQHPRERRDEEPEELALVDGPEAAHSARSLVSCVKTSSSELSAAVASRTRTPFFTRASMTCSVASAIASSAIFLGHTQRQTPSSIFLIDL